MPSLSITASGCILWEWNSSQCQATLLSSAYLRPGPGCLTVSRPYTGATEGQAARQLCKWLKQSEPGTIDAIKRRLIIIYGVGRCRPQIHKQTNSFPDGYLYIYLSIYLSIWWFPFLPIVFPFFWTVSLFYWDIDKFCLFSNNWSIYLHFNFF